MSEKFSDLLNLVSRAAESIGSVGDRRLLLISHYDADGLAAASILVSTLSRLGFALQLVVVEQLTPTTLRSLGRLIGGYPLTLLTDLGSGALKALERIGTRIIVLDHHLPEGETTSIIEVNPHRVGIDGSRDVSSSGLAYLLSRELLSEKALKLAPLAVVGALGDRQDVGRRFRLIGINRLIVDEAVKYNLLKEGVGLRIMGGARRPLVKALAYTTDPFIPGITGDEGAALAFLSNIGIRASKNGEPRTLGDLSREERKKLASELVKHMIGSGYPVSEAERIYGATYTILAEPEGSPLRDAREYAQLLNANGRMGYYALAVALGLGIRGEVLAKALEAAGQYRALLSKVFRHLREEKLVREGKWYVLIDLTEKEFVTERISGAIASLTTPSLARGKLVIVAVRSPEGVKISLRKGRRGPKQVNVGALLKRVAGAVGGSGGGHENAGGASIPAEKLGELLDLIDQEVGRIAGSGG